MSSPQFRPQCFTDGFVQFHRLADTVRGMRDVELVEAMCDRFMAAQEASGRTKQEFAAAVGLTPSQLTNISRYRNPPPHKAIAEANRVYGITTDFIYTGNLAGMRDQGIAERIRQILTKQRVAA